MSGAAEMAGSGMGRNKKGLTSRAQMSAGEERRSYCRNAQTQREGAFWRMRQGISGRLP
jgi:hypothetical protein